MGVNTNDFKGTKFFSCEKTLILFSAHDMFYLKQQKKFFGFTTWTIWLMLIYVKQKNKALNNVIFSEKQRHAALMIEKPTFSIIIVADQSQREILKTLASIQEQLYQPHEVFLSGDDRSPIQGHTLEATKLRWLQLNNLKEITGSHCIFIEAGDRLHAHALYEFASAMNAEPGRDIIYADEDTIDERGLFSNPFFKPDWSPDYLEVFNYMEFPCCYRTKLVIPGYQNHCLYDLALRSTEQSERVYHIPKVLGHRHNYSQKTADQTKKNVSVFLEHTDLFFVIKKF